MRTTSLLMLALALAACRKGDRDEDGYDYPDDCDDANAEISPDAAEICDQIDNNCDGAVDEEDSSNLNTWYADFDADGYGDAATTSPGCVAPVGYETNADDCNDRDAAVHPGALEADCEDPVDYNCDGSAGLVDDDKDGFAACKECDDGDEDVNPGATETPYNGKDDDCEAATRDDDVDGDGVLAADDCDDNDIFVGPNAPEIAYDGVDNDCDPTTPDDDLDNDGENNDVDCDDTNASVNTSGTDVPHDGIDQDCSGADDKDADNDGADATFANGTDCNDSDAAVNPSAAEVPYDGIDNDCKAATKDDDLDGDGFNKSADCNDGNAAVKPGAAEVAYDGVDNDCNAATKDDDLDGDGFVEADDCDDTDADINPDATDVPYDGIDADCAGDTDYDADGDGQGAIEYGEGPDCNDANPLITDCSGKTDTTAAPSCAVAHQADPAAPSGKFWIDPEYNTKAPFEAWCDMTTDGGGYTFLKIDAGGQRNAAQMEAACDVYGMNLFIPRTYGHLNAAYDVAMDATFGPSGRVEYISVLGIYPKTGGATCLNQPFTSLNPTCNWRAGDDGNYFVNWSRAFSEPNGDNGTTSGMTYGWTTNAAGDVRSNGYNDIVAPGYTSQFFMCDTGDKQGPPASTAPKSCLAIKQSNPGAQDGVYTIRPDAQTGDIRTYCDMANGGWTLVAKGRQGWTWDAYGQGAPSGLVNLTDNAVVALPAWTITAVAGKNMNTLLDGVRIDREEIGQSATWKFSNLPGGYFWWELPANWAITYALAGGGTVTGGTSDLQITGNDETRIFTWAWTGHNGVMGFSTGASTTVDADGDGLIDTQDGWMFATENHAIPFTTVWVRR